MRNGGDHYERVAKNPQKPITPEEMLWRPGEEIICILLARDEQDKDTISALIKARAFVDRILGIKIAFLFIFSIERAPKGDSENLTFKESALADILSKYSMKPDLIARHHADWKIVNAFCEGFQIDFDQLPAMVVLTNAFPEEPIIFSLPRPLISSDVIEWLEQLRKVRDKLVQRPTPRSTWKISASIDELRKLAGEIDKAKETLKDALAVLARRYDLPQGAVELFAHLFSRTKGFNTAFEETLRNIHASFDVNFDDNSTKKGNAVTTVRHRLHRLEKLYKQYDSDAPRVRSIIDEELERMDRLIDEMRTFTLRKALTRRTFSVFKKSFDATHSVRARVAELTKFVKSLSELGRALGLD